MALTGSNAAINKLQRVLTDLGLDKVGLPTIAVVGAQSSGKSSVLEAIVGKEFLPRGTGIVTRRPLLLQLEQSSGDEFAEFGHRPGHRLPLGEAVRNEISAETDRECGGDGKAVSDKPIVLRIFSPNVMNLTLVDLPGLTRVRMDSQPKDIVASIRKLVFKFIEKESCLILSVTPANEDLANSDALQAAKMVDPRGQRTIGVLTKVDLMDDGTDAVDVLMGRVIPFKYGIVGVVNRSQAEVESKSTVADSRAKELAFFAEHPAYKDIADQQGSEYLTKRLSHLLSRHVRTYIPTLRNEILSTMNAVRSELDSYGGERAVRAELERDQGSVLLSAVSNFADEFTVMLNGRHAPVTEEDDEIEVVGGARVNWIFHEMFQDTVANVKVKLDEQDIRTCMRNMAGIGAALYAAQEAFEVLIKGQIQRLEGPCLECVELVQQELTSMSELASAASLHRFPELKRAVIDKTRSMIGEATVPLAAFVRNLIKRELAYINTQNTEFVNSPLVLNPQKNEAKEASSPSAVPAPAPQSGAGAGGKKDDGGGWFSSWGSDSKDEERKRKEDEMKAARAKAAAAAAAAAAASAKKDEGGKVTLGGMPSNLGLSDNATDAQKEKAQIAMVQNLTNAYFRIIKKNLADGVPKAIMYFLVNRVKANVQKHLLQELYSEYTFTRLLGESEEMQEVRRRAVESIGLLEEALTTMDEVKRDVA
jgi:dynamin 1-like protein